MPRGGLLRWQCVFSVPRWSVLRLSSARWSTVSSPLFAKSDKGKDAWRRRENQGEKSGDADLPSSSNGRGNYSCGAVPLPANTCLTPRPLNSSSSSASTSSSSLSSLFNAISSQKGLGRTTRQRSHFPASSSTPRSLNSTTTISISIRTRPPAASSTQTHPHLGNAESNSTTVPFSSSSSAPLSVSLLKKLLARVQEKQISWEDMPLEVQALELWGEGEFWMKNYFSPALSADAPPGEKEEVLQKEKEKKIGKIEKDAKQDRLHSKFVVREAEQSNSFDLSSSSLEECTDFYSDAHAGDSTFHNEKDLDNLRRQEMGKGDLHRLRTPRSSSGMATPVFVSAAPTGTGKSLLTPLWVIHSHWRRMECRLRLTIRDLERAQMRKSKKKEEDETRIKREAKCEQNMWKSEKEEEVVLDMRKAGKDNREGEARGNVDSHPSLSESHPRKGEQVKTDVETKMNRLPSSLSVLPLDEKPFPTSSLEEFVLAFKEASRICIVMTQPTRLACRELAQYMARVIAFQQVRRQRRIQQNEMMDKRGRRMTEEEMKGSENGGEETEVDLHSRQVERLAQRVLGEECEEGEGEARGGRAVGEGKDEVGTFCPTGTKRRTRKCGGGRIGYAMSGCTSFSQEHTEIIFATTSYALLSLSHSLSAYDPFFWNRGDWGEEVKVEEGGKGRQRCHCNATSTTTSSKSTNLNDPQNKCERNVLFPPISSCCSSGLLRPTVLILDEAHGRQLDADILLTWARVYRCLQYQHQQQQLSSELILHKEIKEGKEEQKRRNVAHINQEKARDENGEDGMKKESQDTDALHKEGQVKCIDDPREHPLPLLHRSSSTSSLLSGSSGHPPFTASTIFSSSPDRMIPSLKFFIVLSATLSLSAVHRFFASPLPVLPGGGPWQWNAMRVKGELHKVHSQLTSIALPPSPYKSKNDNLDMTPSPHPFFSFPMHSRGLQDSLFFLTQEEHRNIARACYSPPRVPSSPLQQVKVQQDRATNSSSASFHWSDDDGHPPASSPSSSSCGAALTPSLPPLSDPQWWEWGVEVQERKFQLPSSSSSSQITPSKKINLLSSSSSSSSASTSSSSPFSSGARYTVEEYFLEDLPDAFFTSPLVSCSSSSSFTPQLFSAQGKRELRHMKHIFLPRSASLSAPSPSSSPCVLSRHHRRGTSTSLSSSHAFSRPPPLRLDPRHYKSIANLILRLLEVIQWRWGEGKEEERGGGRRVGYTEGKSNTDVEGRCHPRTFSVSSTSSPPTLLVFLPGIGEIHQVLMMLEAMCTPALVTLALPSPHARHRSNEDGDSLRCHPHPHGGGGACHTAAALSPIQSAASEIPVLCYDRGERSIAFSAVTLHRQLALPSENYLKASEYFELLRVGPEEREDERRSSQGYGLSHHLDGNSPLRHHSSSSLPTLSSPLRLILSTSIAESSVTIPHLRGVIDLALDRVFVADNSSGTTRKETSLVSASSLLQRRGRVGRTCDGFILHLTSKHYFCPDVTRQDRVDRKMGGAKKAEEGEQKRKQEEGGSLMGMTSAREVAHPDSILSTSSGFPPALFLPPHWCRYGFVPLPDSAATILLRISSLFPSLTGVMVGGLPCTPSLFALVSGQDELVEKRLWKRIGKQSSSNSNTPIGGGLSPTPSLPPLASSWSQFLQNLQPPLPHFTPNSPPHLSSSSSSSPSNFFSLLTVKGMLVAALPLPLSSAVLVYHGVQFMCLEDTVLLGCAMSVPGLLISPRVLPLRGVEPLIPCKGGNGYHAQPHRVKGGGAGTNNHYNINGERTSITHPSHTTDESGGCAQSEMNPHYSSSSSSLSSSIAEEYHMLHNPLQQFIHYFRTLRRLAGHPVDEEKQDSFTPCMMRELDGNENDVDVEDKLLQEKTNGGDQRVSIRTKKTKQCGVEEDVKRFKGRPASPHPNTSSHPSHLSEPLLLRDILRGWYMCKTLEDAWSYISEYHIHRGALKQVDLSIYQCCRRLLEVLPSRRHLMPQSSLTQDVWSARGGEEEGDSVGLPPTVVSSLTDMMARHFGEGVPAAYLPALQTSLYRLQHAAYVRAIHFSSFLYGGGGTSSFSFASSCSTAPSDCMLHGGNRTSASRLMLPQWYYPEPSYSRIFRQHYLPQAQSLGNDNTAEGQHVSGGEGDCSENYPPSPLHRYDRKRKFPFFPSSPSSSSFASPHAGFLPLHPQVLEKKEHKTKIKRESKRIEIMEGKEKGERATEIPQNDRLLVVPSSFSSSSPPSLSYYFGLPEDRLCAAFVASFAQFTLQGEDGGHRHHHRRMVRNGGVLSGATDEACAMEVELRVRPSPVATNLTPSNSQHNPMNNDLHHRHSPNRSSSFLDSVSSSILMPRGEAPSCPREGRRTTAGGDASLSSGLTLSTSSLFNSLSLYFPPARGRSALREDFSSSPTRMLACRWSGKAQSANATQPTQHPLPQASRCHHKEGEEERGVIGLEAVHVFQSPNLLPPPNSWSKEKGSMLRSMRLTILAVYSNVSSSLGFSRKENRTGGPHSPPSPLSQEGGESRTGENILLSRRPLTFEESSGCSPFTASVSSSLGRGMRGEGRTGSELSGVVGHPPPTPTLQHSPSPSSATSIVRLPPFGISVLWGTWPLLPLLPVTLHYSAESSLQAVGTPTEKNKSPPDSCSAISGAVKAANSTTRRSNTTASTTNKRSSAGNKGSPKMNSEKKGVTSFSSLPTLKVWKELSSPRLLSTGTKHNSVLTGERQEGNSAREEDVTVRWIDKSGGTASTCFSLRRSSLLPLGLEYLFPSSSLLSDISNTSSAPNLRKIVQEKEDKEKSPTDVSCPTLSTSTTTTSTRTSASTHHHLHENTGTSTMEDDYRAALKPPPSSSSSLTSVNGTIQIIGKLQLERRICWKGQLLSMSSFYHNFFHSSSRARDWSPYVAAPPQTGRYQEECSPPSSSSSTCKKSKVKVDENGRREVLPAVPTTTATLVPPPPPPPSSSCYCPVCFSVFSQPQYFASHCLSPTHLSHLRRCVEYGITLEHLLFLQQPASTRRPSASTRPASMEVGERHHGKHNDHGNRSSQNSASPPHRNISRDNKQEEGRGEIHSEKGENHGKKGSTEINEDTKGGTTTATDVLTSERTTMMRRGADSINDENTKLKIRENTQSDELRSAEEEENHESIVKKGMPEVQRQNQTNWRHPNGVDMISSLFFPMRSGDRREGAFPSTLPASTSPFSSFPLPPSSFSSILTTESISCFAHPQSFLNVLQCADARYAPLAVAGGLRAVIGNRGAGGKGFGSSCSSAYSNEEEVTMSLAEESGTEVLIPSQYLPDSALSSSGSSTITTAAHSSVPPSSCRSAVHHECDGFDEGEEVEREYLHHRYEDVVGWGAQHIWVLPFPLPPLPSFVPCPVSAGENTKSTAMRGEYPSLHQGHPPPLPSTTAASPTTTTTTTSMTTPIPHRALSPIFVLAGYLAAATRHSPVALLFDGPHKWVFGIMLLHGGGGAGVWSFPSPIPIGDGLTSVLGGLAGGRWMWPGLLLDSDAFPHGKHALPRKEGSQDLHWCTLHRSCCKDCHTTDHRSSTSWTGDGGGGTTGRALAGRKYPTEGEPRSEVRDPSVCASVKRKSEQVKKWKKEEDGVKNVEQQHALVHSALLLVLYEYFLSSRSVITVSEYLERVLAKLRRNTSMDSSCTNPHDRHERSILSSPLPPTPPLPHDPPSRHPPTSTSIAPPTISTTSAIHKGVEIDLLQEYMSTHYPGLTLVDLLRLVGCRFLLPSKEIVRQPLRRSEELEETAEKYSEKEKGEDTEMKRLTSMTTSSCSTSSSRVSFRLATPSMDFRCTLPSVLPSRLPPADFVHRVEEEMGRFSME